MYLVVTVENLAAVEEGGGLAKVVVPAGGGLNAVVEGFGDCSGENLVCENPALLNGLDTTGARLPTTDALKLLLA